MIANIPPLILFWSCTFGIVKTPLVGTLNILYYLSDLCIGKSFFKKRFFPYLCCETYLHTLQINVYENVESLQIVSCLVGNMSIRFYWCTAIYKNVHQTMHFIWMKTFYWWTITCKISIVCAQYDWLLFLCTIFWFIGTLYSLSLPRTW